MSVNPSRRIWVNLTGVEKYKANQRVNNVYYSRGVLYLCGYNIRQKAVRQIFNFPYDKQRPLLPYVMTLNDNDMKRYEGTGGGKWYQNAPFIRYKIESGPPKRT